jgi:hypothetical protein
MYSEDESTVEFAARLREELGIGTDTTPAQRRSRIRGRARRTPTVTR